jgi:hypothetical protein
MPDVSRTSIPHNSLRPCGAGIYIKRIDLLSGIVHSYYLIMITVMRGVEQMFLFFHYFPIFLSYTPVQIIKNMIVFHEEAAL